MSGILIVTDPDQEKIGLYKICKTLNSSQTLMALNAARASKDFKIIKFYSCQDLKKSEEFIKQAIKNKLFTGSTEWVKLDEAGLTKIISTIETLINIVNDS